MAQPITSKLAILAARMDDFTRAENDAMQRQLCHQQMQIDQLRAHLRAQITGNRVWRDRVAALRAQLENAEGEIDGYQTMINYYQDEHDAMIAENAHLRQQLGMRTLPPSFLAAAEAAAIADVEMFGSDSETDSEMEVEM